MDAKRSVNILIADDDPDDRALTEEAFRESMLRNKTFFVENGEERLDYLMRRVIYIYFVV